jgi:pyrroline-5-carboxylate reductase
MRTTLSKNISSHEDPVNNGQFVLSTMATLFHMEFEKQMHNCGKLKIRKMPLNLVLDEFAKTTAEVIDGELVREEFTSLANEVMEAVGMSIGERFKIDGNRIAVVEYSFNFKESIYYKFDD